MQKNQEVVEVSLVSMSNQEYEAFMLRLTNKELLDEDYSLIAGVFANKKHLSERRRQRILDKLADQDTLTNSNNNQSLTNAAETGGDKHPSSLDEAKPVKGHGRRGANDYPQGKEIRYPNSKSQGDLCSECYKGRLYQFREKVILRFIGNTPIEAEKHMFNVLRCNFCDAVYQPQVPEELLNSFGQFHYSACALFAVWHYYGGMPLDRLETILGHMDMPVSSSTQWDKLDQTDETLMPLFNYLEHYAINKSKTVRLDDSGSNIVSVKKEIKAELNEVLALGGKKEDVRVGINSSVFYFEAELGIVILFYTGRHHAGEIFDKLMHRKTSLHPLIKVSDAASKNFNHNHKALTIEGVCNAHALVKFKNIETTYPKEVSFVKNIYKKVYKNDKFCKDRGFNDQNRLIYHQKHSTPHMETLKSWIIEKIQKRKVEPNSSLGEAMGYIANQWPKLTMFLQYPGVPLDSNLVEQTIKLVIRYRNNSRVFKTQNGADVGDRLLSIISTAVAHDVNPVNYLEWCLINQTNLKKQPHQYTPWVYKKHLNSS